MVEQFFYGTTAAGEPVQGYRLTNPNGAEVRLIEYGCRITHWLVPGPNGPTDIVLGCRDLAGYEADEFFFGSFVGRFANRIEKGRFELDGKQYQLSINNGPNHNHGVWHQRVFAGEIQGDGTVVLRYHSPDGEDGFPGNVEVTVRCTLTEDDRLVLDYTAAAAAATPINLTNHSYFNLSGQGDVLGHTLQVFADEFTPADEFSCPFGDLQPVAGTPFDFTLPHTIGRDINSEEAQIQWGCGYDHNYVVRRAAPGLVPAARAQSPDTGIWLECRTTQPGLQLYTANWVRPAPGDKPGFAYGPRAAFCLETQHFPCGPNRPQFPSCTLRPGHLLHEVTEYAFGRGRPT